MASVFKQPGNRYWIQIRLCTKDETKKKKFTWRLGKVEKKTAQDFKLKLETLAEHVENNLALPVEISNWIQSLSDKHRKWLIDRGLVSEAGSNASAPETLSDFIDFCIENHYKTSAKNTRRNMRTAGNGMVEYFGKDKRVDQITTGDLEVWKSDLIDEDNSDANVAFYLKKARRFLNLAVSHRVVDETTFQNIKIPSEQNKDREVYVPVDTIRQLLRSCSPVWQAIVCLIRFGGIRCPTDVVKIKWEQVNFPEKRLTAYRQKTSRFIAIPMVPELEYALQRLWDCSEGEDSIYLFPDYVDRDSDRTIYAQLKRLVVRAGLTPWPKLTTNMRISWGQDLKMQGIPASTIAYWMDHTEDVHKKHYEIIDASEYDAATKLDSGLFSNRDSKRPPKKRSNASKKRSQKRSK